MTQGTFTPVAKIQGTYDGKPVDLTLSLDFVTMVQCQLSTTFGYMNQNSEQISEAIGDMVETTLNRSIPVTPPHNLD